MHFFWDACENKTHKYHNKFLNHFRRIDEVVGEISKQLSDGDLLLLLSDHGFEHLEHDVYINRILQNNGFLRLDAVQEPRWSDIRAETKAFALDPARIYINEKGKYPLGSVRSEDKERTKQELVDFFQSLVIEGKKVIRAVHRKEDIYHGPLLSQAPDLVLIGNHGFNLKSSLNTKKEWEKGIFNGKHTQDDAFVLVNKTDVPSSPQVFDIANIINEYFGIH